MINSVKKQEEKPEQNIQQASEEQKQSQQQDILQQQPNTNNQKEDNQQNNSENIQQQINITENQANQQEQQLQEQEKDVEYQHTDPKFEVREATYAGCWYTEKQNELDVQLNVWIDMAKCEIQNVQSIKSLIVPHSGFSFSGPTAAWAYKYLKIHKSQEKKLKVFLLGPAHYCFLRSCCLSTLKTYKTPLGDIEIDQQIIKELFESGVEFQETDKDADEEEYSLEMQLPFLAKVLGVENFTLIPILVGSFDESTEEQYSKVLQPYFEREDSLFVISTDFCHWGNKYKYTYMGKEEGGEIYEVIEKLDQKAMELLELHDIDGFHEYIKETRNTICGKHSLAILLRLFLNSKIHEIETKFIKYSMGQVIKDKSENSISYATAVSYKEKNTQNNTMVHN